METTTLKKATKRTLPAAVKLAVQAGLDKKAEDVLVLDLREIASFTEYFVIMSGRSTRQNQAVFDAVKDVLKKKKILPLGAEGLESGEWILIDYGSFLVHIFSPRLRDAYVLEKLWGDAPRLSFGPET
ncbi:MAG: ribosome silencing factor [Candidatus Aminicenantes bacterium]|nr:ribosome silencing factor [Candidatus Aminicenantes bacterium]